MAGNWSQPGGRQHHLGKICAGRSIHQRAPDTRAGCSAGLRGAPQASPRMRILFLNPSGQLGGAELSLLDVMASLHARQPDWKLGLVASDAGPLVDAANALGAETHVLPFPTRLSQLGDATLPSGRFAITKDLAVSALPAWGYKRRLARVIRTFAPDVIHTNGFKMHVLGAMASNGRPVLWHVRDFVSIRPVMARLLRQVAGSRTLVVANSNAVADDVRVVLAQGVLDQRTRVRTIHNAIDLNPFSPDRNRPYPARISVFTRQPLLTLRIS